MEDTNMMPNFSNRLHYSISYITKGSSVDIEFLYIFSYMYVVCVLPRITILQRTQLLKIIQEFIHWHAV